jgi:hypothetical protein
MTIRLIAAGLPIGIMLRGKPFLDIPGLRRRKKGNAEKKREDEPAH